jgi:coenzyme PQQ synthesis protein D (PqqD)
MTGDEMSAPPRKNPHAASRVYDGEAFIVVPQSHEYKILNAVGSRVWDLIDGRRSPGDIAEIIASEYDVSMDMALSDVREFLADLQANGMLSGGEAGKVA